MDARPRRAESAPVLELRVTAGAREFRSVVVRAYSRVPVRGSDSLPGRRENLACLVENLLARIVCPPFGRSLPSPQIFDRIGRLLRIDERMMVPTQQDEVGV